MDTYDIFQNSDTTENNVEIYEIDPYVATYDNILSQKECDHFIEISKDKFKRALVSDSKGGTVSAGRTGSNYWLSHTHDDITSLVAERISKIVGMPIENAERFQMIYYGENQEYRLHYDSWENDGSEKTLRCIKYGGPRLVTALCYLNTVEKGGGTKMTKLNQTIEALRGRLLVFNNTTPDKNSIHNRHPLSEHAGLPVIKGYKYAFNLWFKEENASKLYSVTSPEKYQLYLNKPKTTVQSKPASSSAKPASSSAKPASLSTSDDLSYTIPDENIIQPSYNNYLFKNPTETISESDYLEIGDFIPYIEINGINHNIHLHSYGTFKDFIIITHKNLNNIYNIQQGLYSIRSYFNIITTSIHGMQNTSGLDSGIVYSLDPQLNKLLKVTDELLFYIINPNRQIKQILTFNSFKTLITSKQPLYKKVPQTAPYMLIENVLDPVLYRKVILYYNQNINNRICHVVPDKSLEYELDHKISRSILPQIKQAFNFNVQYREPYKIKGYNKNTYTQFKEKFEITRNTIPNAQHRQYSMIICVNSNYKGGDLVLPEYNLKFNSLANSAIIFPSIFAQQIHEVLAGTKIFITTFFINKKSSKYKLKVNYFEKNNIIESDIYSKH